MALSPKSPQFVGVGCERICGGRRRRSGPEASPEANRRGRSDCAPWTADVVGKTAVGVATSRRAKAWTGLVGGGSAVGPGKRHGLWRARCRILRRDTVLFLSDLEAQKLRFQGADHFAALRGPSRRAGKNSWAFLLQAGDHTVEQYLLLKELAKNKKSPPHEGRYRSYWDAIVPPKVKKA
jgi:hypothetical protein